MHKKFQYKYIKSLLDYFYSLFPRGEVSKINKQDKNVTFHFA